jgi:sugar phosphate permease
MVLWLCEFSSVSAKHLFTLAQSICSHFSTHDERSPLECRYCTVSPSPYVTISWTSQLTSGANIIATAVAGLISAATFATLGGAHGIAGWRWLFIILGVVTFGIAIIALWALPDHPLTTRWLKPEEQQLAHSRMERDTVGLEESKGAWVGLKQAAKDSKLWFLTLLQLLHLCACGFNSFFPTVVKTLGYSTTVTLVITCPPYLCAGAFSVALAWSSGRRNEKSWHIVAGMVVALIGFIMAAASLNTGVRFVSLFLFATGAYS